MKSYSHSRLSNIRNFFAPIDGVLMFVLLLIAVLSLVTMWSAASDKPQRFDDHVRNIMLGFAVMMLVAYVPTQWLMKAATPLYLLGVVLLIGVAVFGQTRLGAKRWLNVGFTVIQPSELLKIAVPLMLAYFFHIAGIVQGKKAWRTYAIAALLLLIPFLLIAKQPDLGTALLVVFAGAYVIFFAGLPWRAIAGVFVVTAIMLVAVIRPETNHYFLEPYQQDRINVLLHANKPSVVAGQKTPEQIAKDRDMKKKGYQVEQAVTAIGSGGWLGKGWQQGTQTHLQFLPERSTDIVLAVYSEEFGLAGVILLLVLYSVLILRGLSIAYGAATRFERLLAGAISMIIFTYVFVNMGMVAGMLPVVGVPLPFMSYGGTALVTLGVGCGMLMSVRHHRIR
ncbi:MAG: rod shape-determining protein RodA [Formosimonas sp.]